MRCRFLLLSFICLALTPRAYASETMGLDDFVGRVLQQGPHRSAIDATVAQSQAEVDASGLWPNPGVRLERQSGPVLDQAKGSQDFLLVEMPLVVSGRLGLEHEAAQARAAAANADARVQTAALHREAVHIYVDTVRAQRLVGVLLEEHNHLLTVVEASRRKTAAGANAPTTTLRLEVELARLEDDLRLARLAVEDARQRAQLLAGSVLPSFQEDFPSLPKVTTTHERASTVALGRRLEGAALDEQAAVRKMFPDVTVTGGPALLSTGSSDFGVGYAVSLGVGVPVFDHGQGESSRARANQAAIQAERQLLAGRQSTDLEMARRHATSAADRVMSYARSVVPAAQTLFEAAARSMELGSADEDAAAVLVFVDAANMRREARITLDQLRASAVLADANLTLVSGAWDAPKESQP
jgi:outer membrane protein, heavy metal efflux system